MRRIRPKCDKCTRRPDESDPIARQIDDLLENL